MATQRNYAQQLDAVLATLGEMCIRDRSIINTFGASVIAGYSAAV